MVKLGTLVNGLANRIVVWGKLVKFSHSVFALPFALSMLVLVSSEYKVTSIQIIEMVVCIISARFAAMAFNRFLDRGIDARNPRTSLREIPHGLVKPWEVVALILLSSLVFLTFSRLLSPLCGLLAWPVLVVLFGYSYLKRISPLCHIVLGLSLAVAPGGVWLAITNEWAWRPVTLMLGVMMWVAGFDVVYALQDLNFDRDNQLRSIPETLGERRARILAFLFHVAAVICFLITGALFAVGTVFWIGLCIFGALIATQHITLSVNRNAHIEAMFFLRNGLASVVFFIFTALDVVSR